jgi:hypothetical protein
VDARIPKYSSATAAACSPEKAGEVVVSIRRMIAWVDSSDMAVE